MANTRQSAKRSRQELKRQTRNRIRRSTSSTALKKAYVLFAAAKLKRPELEMATTLYKNAVRAVSKAAAKGAIARGRAKRKISRLTKLAMENFPESLPFGKNAAPKATKAAKPASKST